MASIFDKVGEGTWERLSEAVKGITADPEHDGKLRTRSVRQRREDRAFAAFLTQATEAQEKASRITDRTGTADDRVIDVDDL